MSCISPVRVIITPPLGLIITTVTLQDCVTVFSCYVSLKTTLCCSLIITLITRILYTFMLGLNMNLKTTLLCSLIITLITLFFHGQTQNVLSDHFYKYIVCHIAYKDTLPPHELI